MPTAGLSDYVDQMVGIAAAVPTYGRHTARIWTRKVLYSDIWRKNKAALDLPEVGDETYDAVMPELFKICEEEYGFQHKDERVCKAMFQVRSMLPSANNRTAHAEIALLTCSGFHWGRRAADGGQARR